MRSFSSKTLQTLVKCVRQRPDFSRTGQWEVVTENKDGQEEKHVFDAVICCSGHYTFPHLPLKDFPGELQFGKKFLVKKMCLCKCSNRCSGPGFEWDNEVWREQVVQSLDWSNIIKKTTPNCHCEFISHIP